MWAREGPLGVPVHPQCLFGGALEWLARNVGYDFMAVALVGDNK